MGLSNAKKQQAAPGAGSRKAAVKIDVTSLSIKQKARVAARTKAAAPRQPIVDYVAAAARFGADVKRPVPPSKVAQILRRIARDSVDLFGTQQAALDYLERATFTQEGDRAAEVMAKKGVGPVLGRLEDLRYGPRG